jgi:hypothetical protein
MLSTSSDVHFIGQSRDDTETAGNGGLGHGEPFARRARITVILSGPEGADSELLATSQGRGRDVIGTCISCQKLATICQLTSV